MTRRFKFTGSFTSLLHRTGIVAALGVALFLTTGARGQDQAPPAHPSTPQSNPPQPNSSQPNSAQPNSPSSGSPQPTAPQSSHAAADKTDPNQPQVYDPYHAMKAMEVGLYYLRKGDQEAALDRFQDAIRYKYDFARPRLLVGEIYERRHDNAQAIRYYSEYLKILPQAPDAKKVRERIERLSKHD
jgi:tetratricopeptide (TPR) repeat protein